MMKVLIIDDDPDLLDILKDWLEMCGFTAQTLNGTEDLLAEIICTRPDVILIDYLLPAVNGAEVCALIKNQEELQGIPLILMTAYPRMLMAVDEHSCDSIISKPFDLNDLKTLIDDLLIIKA